MSSAFSDGITGIIPRISRITFRSVRFHYYIQKLECIARDAAAPILASQEIMLPFLANLQENRYFFNVNF